MQQNFLSTWPKDGRKFRNAIQTRWYYYSTILRVSFHLLAFCLIVTRPLLSLTSCLQYRQKEGEAFTGTMAVDNGASREALLFYSEWSTLPSDIYVYLFDQNCVTWITPSYRGSWETNTFSCQVHCCSKQSWDTVHDQEREIHAKQATGSICHEPQPPTACLDHLSFSKFCRYWALTVGLKFPHSKYSWFVLLAQGQKRPAWFNNSTCVKDLDLIVKSVRANRVMMLPKKVIRFLGCINRNIESEQEKRWRPCPSGLSHPTQSTAPPSWTSPLNKDT